MSLEDDLRTVWTALAKDDRPDTPVLVAFSRIANALSPTQETDRPDIEEIGRGIARDFGKTFDILAKADRPAQETDPG